MKEIREINAVELRPVHAGWVIEFETVVTPDLYGTGLGDLGHPVLIHGDLVTVTNGHTMGRAWSKVTVMAEVFHEGLARRVRIESVLGSHRTVTLTGEPGFGRNSHLVMVDNPVSSGGLTFAPGVYRAQPVDGEPDRYGIRFHGTTYPLPPLPDAET